MSKNLEGRKAIRDLIKDTCENKKDFINQFRMGYEILDDNRKAEYPLAYLDRQMPFSTNGSDIIYRVTLTIADTVGKTPTDEELNIAYEKVEFMITEIHYALTQYSRKFRVSDIDVVDYENYDSDSLVVMRGEFTISMPRYTQKSTVSK